MQLSRFVIMALAGASLAVPVLAAQPKTNNGHFVDDNGATLYTYDKDTPGKSACDAACAKNWPPALAGDTDTASGDWTFVQTHDGKKQWAYKGKPLYRFVKDANPGDATGDGARGVWHIAKP